MNASKSLNVFGVLLLLLFVSHQAQALDWQHLWSTPEQQAKQRLDSEQYDELIEQAPDVNWRGIGEYRKGDYSAAIESFAEQREAASLAGSADEVEQAMYNQANAHTLNENYPEAIELFDEIVQLNPDHADAIHNRAIAEQLLEQQQQEQQQEQNSDGEPQDGEQQDGEQQDGEKGEPSSSEHQDGEQEQSDQQKSDQQQSDEEQSGQGSSDDREQSAEDAQSAEEQAKQDEQAAKAMQAEQAKNANNDEAGDETTGEVTTTGGMPPTDPLTEKEQANEQWLRQIPDDPAGLLQRKLQNRHLTDFPKVKDSVNPW